MTFPKGTFGSLTMFEMNGKKFVVKRANPTYERSILNEINILTDLQHKNIVSIVSYDKLEPFYVMPYINGRDLYFVLSESEQPASEFLFYIYGEVLNALEYCHENSVYHLDIKPENIMIEHGTNKVYLIDFGHATNSNIISSKFNIGTLEYDPPEVILKIPYVPEEVDSWQVGILFYEICTFQVPFNGGIESADYEKYIKTGNLRLPYSLKDTVVKFIFSLIRPVPAERLSIKEIKCEFKKLITLL